MKLFLVSLLTAYCQFNKSFIQSLQKESQYGVDVSNLIQFSDKDKEDIGDIVQRAYNQIQEGKENEKKIVEEQKVYCKDQIDPYEKNIKKLTSKISKLEKELQQKQTFGKTLQTQIDELKQSINNATVTTLIDKSIVENISNALKIVNRLIDHNSDLSLSQIKDYQHKISIATSLINLNLAQLESQSLESQLKLLQNQLQINLTQQKVLLDTQLLQQKQEKEQLKKLKVKLETLQLKQANNNFDIKQMQRSISFEKSEKDGIQKLLQKVKSYCDLKIEQTNYTDHELVLEKVQSQIE